LKTPQNTSRIEISRSAYFHNLKVIRKLIGEKTIFASVVKGNAYGHGINEFVPMAYEAGVKNFAVFDAYEACRVKQCIDEEIFLLVMGLTHDDELEWVLENDVDFYVYNMDRLEKAAEISKKLNKPARVHIEVETGMNRTGFEMKEIGEVINFIKKNSKYIKFRGLCMHFAGAESLANYLRVQAQYANYQLFVQEFEKAGLSPEIRHTACSAAVLSYPDTILDMVRIGILQYGLWPSKEISVLNFVQDRNKNYKLKRVISWKSRVMSVKNVKAGEYVGYGNSYLAEKDIKIAVLPVGYAHGFSRVLSNVGKVLINGKRLSVIGLVNMNCMTVDITNAKEVKPGDEAVIIGKQNNQDLTVGSFSDLSNQLNYELLSRLPNDIPRYIIE
jgi:alanine racemase